MAKRKCARCERDQSDAATICTACSRDLKRTLRHIGNLWPTGGACMLASPELVVELKQPRERANAHRGLTQTVRSHRTEGSMKPTRPKGYNDRYILQAIAERPDWLSSRVAPNLIGYPDVGSCWLWSGALTSEGYGSTHLPHSVVKRTMVGVHRVMWIALRGRIPAGYVVDHGGAGCGNRACANPAHLSVVTERTNTLITSASMPAKNLRKTHCPKGHPLEAGNLRPRKGRRECLTCNREYNRETARLVRSAAQLLGLNEKQYRAIHGQSRATARRFIAERVAA